MEAANGPLRLLSLDGGGLRWLSSIMILQQIMRVLNKTLKRPENDPLHPYQVFDMIGGTSTGGIIAIMLGRLKMTLRECEDAYLKLSEQIFQTKSSKFNKFGQGLDLVEGVGKFDALALENAIKSLKAEMSHRTCCWQTQSLPAKFVCAMRTTNSDPGLLRSYDNPEQNPLLHDECKLWEACRATSAATLFFDPITIGRHRQVFVDGAIIYNNPVQLVHQEAVDLWPGREYLMISIGTGSAPAGPFKGNIKNIVEGMKNILVETDRRARDFDKGHPEISGKGLWYRFNVTQGLSEVGLEEYRAVDTIANATQSYVNDGETGRKVKACVHKLCGNAMAGTAPPPAYSFTETLPLH